MQYIVDHTGGCAGYHYQAGKPVELPDDVVAALGSHAQPANAVDKVAKAVTSTVKRVVKPNKDKMVRAGKTVQK